MLGGVGLSVMCGAHCPGFDLKGVYGASILRVADTYVGGVSFFLVTHVGRTQIVFL